MPDDFVQNQYDDLFGFEIVIPIVVGSLVVGSMLVLIENKNNPFLMEPVNVAGMGVGMEPVIESVIGSVIEPVIESVIESVMESVMEPVMEPVLESVMHFVMEPVTEPVIVLLIQPVMDFEMMQMKPGI